MWFNHNVNQISGYWKHQSFHSPISEKEPSGLFVLPQTYSHFGLVRLSSLCPCTLWLIDVHDYVFLYKAMVSYSYFIVSIFSSQKCFATVSAVVAEVEENKTFDSERAGLLVKELRKSFNSGRTKSYEWRMLQLNNIARMLDEKERDIIEALYKDLSKPELEAFISEV